MKKLILTSAIAGSGKSTLARQLKERYESEGYTVFTIETDEWFVNYGGGTYKFERSLLNSAHMWTFQKVIEAFRDGFNIVILANTNLVWKELKRYVLSAREWEYESEIVAPDTPWCNNPEECKKRNSHGVPLDQLIKMEQKRQPIEYLRQKVKESYQEKYKW